ncbi:hypothetical protein [Rufibacter roseus]|uniref:DUF5673 domain-containing protein n=1 Tax=Rufibacter roseus TaxID=1567108 RepID=A0ABW2DS60_9BACT|nr:hypothetical protein [Rufibacter roseus]
MSDFLVYLIIGVAVSLTMFLLKRSTGKETHKNEEGFIELRMPKLYAVAGIVGFGIGLIFLMAMVMVDDMSLGESIGITAVMLGIFWGAGIPCFLWYKNHRVTFDETTVEVKSVFGKVKKVNWQEIEHVQFHAFSGLIKLTDVYNTKVGVHQHLKGLYSFAEMLEKETDWNAAELKLPIQKRPVTSKA